MGKLRSVNTEFWSDPWIEELNPTEKLLYLYLITNEKTNMLGVYELSIKKISFETGLNHSQVDSALKHFERVKKVKYTKNYIVLINFTKHQNYNTNMMKSAIDVFNNLPNELKTNEITVCKDNPLKGFERVSKDLGMVRKIEDELEDETKPEDEEQKAKRENEFEVFWDAFGKKVDRKKCETKFLKLSDSEVKKILNVVENYVKSTPDEKYRKHPYTWLNGECWNDEINIKSERKYTAHDNMAF